MTAQMHERLIIDGEETSMAFCPPLPEGHPRLRQIDPASAGDKSDAALLYNTACWRRYVGTWEIRDGRFYLVRVRGIYRLAGEDPLLADWFSGVLRVPGGARLQYVHMGFGSVYEEELHIKIESGRVVASRLIDNRGRHFDERDLALKNLPGGENHFPGDDQL